jgi:tRNA-Thr(GGU) m(6)t(6)A37 methyltransferase TsaA
MQTSRRGFLAGTAGAGLAASWTVHAATTTSPVAGEEPKTVFQLYPVGVVEKKDKEKEKVVRLRIFDEYKDALLGLDGWSHLQVFYWFDQNDTPQKRRILRVRPQGNQANPLTGVFACRAPFRPNLIALSVCKIRSVEGNLVNLEDLDAFDGTPILDLKPFTPPDAPPPETVRVPAWARGER